MAELLHATLPSIASAFSGGLFQVWIDVNLGCGTPDWWWNDEPTALGEALADAADARNRGFPTMIVPAGSNPRADGRWTNPV